ncbi:unnamed protein product, partial [Staurois parvus]
PLAARHVNHWVPARDSQPALGNHRPKLTGGRPVCKQHRSLLCQHGHVVLYFSAQQTACLPSKTAQRTHSKTHTAYS